MRRVSRRSGMALGLAAASAALQPQRDPPLAHPRADPPVGVQHPRPTDADGPVLVPPACRRPPSVAGTRGLLQSAGGGGHALRSHGQGERAPLSVAGILGASAGDRDSLSLGERVANPGSPEGSVSA